MKKNMLFICLCFISAANLKAENLKFVCKLVGTNHFTGYMSDHAEAKGKSILGSMEGNAGGIKILFGMKYRMKVVSLTEEHIGVSIYAPKKNDLDNDFLNGITNYLNELNIPFASRSIHYPEAKVYKVTTVLSIEVENSDDGGQLIAKVRDKIQLSAGRIINDVPLAEMMQN